MSCGTYQIIDYDKQNIASKQDSYNYDLIKKDKKIVEWYVEKNKNETGNIYYSGVLIRFGK
jgi:hypothetical protein